MYVQFDWVVSVTIEYDEPNDPISRIIGLLQAIASSHCQLVNAIIVGYMLPLRSEADLNLFLALIAKPVNVKGGTPSAT
jgi:hypothetical protein